MQGLVSFDRTRIRIGIRCTKYFIELSSVENLANYYVGSNSNVILSRSTVRRVRSRSVLRWWYAQRVHDLGLARKKPLCGGDF